jgi:hypothetical protein
MTFKNIKITYQSKLRFLGIYITENVTWGAHARSLRTELCKVAYMRRIEKKGLYMIKKNVLFEFSIMPQVWHFIMRWG